MKATHTHISSIHPARTEYICTTLLLWQMYQMGSRSGSIIYKHTIYNGVLCICVVHWKIFPVRFFFCVCKPTVRRDLYRKPNKTTKPSTTTTRTHNQPKATRGHRGGKCVHRRVHFHTLVKLRSLGLTHTKNTNE